MGRKIAKKIFYFQPTVLKTCLAVTPNILVSVQWIGNQTKR